MTARTCTCGEPLPDERTICSRCTTQLSHHLGDQEAHREELTTALTRQVRMNAPNDGSRGNSPALEWKRMGERYLDSIGPEEVRRLTASLPPARAAADALHAQRALLVAWCRLLWEERQIPLPEQDTIRAMSLHLERNLRVLHTHEAAGELVAEVRDLVKQILRVIDTPINRTRIMVGPCVAVIDDMECQGEVEAIVPHDETVPPLLRCRLCRSEWPSEQWTRVGRIIRQKKEAA